MSLRARLAQWIGVPTLVPARKRTADRAIERLSPSAWVSVPLAGAAPTVQVGDVVAAGALIARSQAGARWQRRVHSPYQGAVVSVDERAIVVEGAPLPAAAGSAQHTGAAGLAPSDIIVTVREAGVTGLGGAMFPTYAKLGTSVDTVLVNGCESEPYFTCDHRVLAEHGDEVRCGLALAKRAVNADHGAIVDREAYYPAGYERFLIRDELDRVLAPHALPRDVGVLVMNVQSARALCVAVCGETPMIERVITVAGDAVGRPGNYVVAIGTPVAHLLRVCEIDQARAATIITGGPMMGRALEAGAVVTAGTGGLLALTADEVAAREEVPCIRCGRCLEACPVGLPVAKIVERPGPEVLRCMECGACQYVCPSAIPLVERLRLAKRREVEWD